MAEVLIGSKLERESHENNLKMCATLRHEHQYRVGTWFEPCLLRAFVRFAFVVAVEKHADRAAGLFVRDEVRHLLTSRVTKLAMDENLTLSASWFYSPTDEDAYVRLSTSYKYSDEMTITADGNIFTGKHENTEFGQFRENDNVYLKLTYGF